MVLSPIPTAASWLQAGMRDCLSPWALTALRCRSCISFPLGGLMHTFGVYVTRAQPAEVAKDTSPGSRVLVPAQGHHRAGDPALGADGAADSCSWMQSLATFFGTGSALPTCYPCCVLSYGASQLFIAALVTEGHRGHSARVPSQPRCSL